MDVGNDYVIKESQDATTSGSTINFVIYQHKKLFALNSSELVLISFRMCLSSLIHYSMNSFRLTEQKKMPYAVGLLDPSIHPSTFIYGASIHIQRRSLHNREKPN